LVKEYFTNIFVLYTETLKEKVMKTNVKLIVIILTIALSFAIERKPVVAQQVHVSFGVFYENLSPYGQWVHYPKHGYVWFPDVDYDFVPYATNGHWVMTQYGMTWVSDYRWGWAPFHYGRWHFDDMYGWFWIPDNEWGPAWVVWRKSHGYYGWCPMGPGVSISISFNNHYNPYGHWIFVRDRDIDRRDIHRYYVDRRHHNRIIRSSTIINNTYIDNSTHITYVSGPGRDEIQRRTGRNIRTVSVNEYNSPGHEMRDNQLNIYRPRVRKDNDEKYRAVPDRVADLEKIKRHSEKKSPNQQITTNPDYKNNRQDNPTGINNQNRQNQQQDKNNQYRQRTDDQKNQTNNRNQSGINQKNNRQNIENKQNNNRKVEQGNSQNNEKKRTNTNQSHNKRDDKQNKSNANENKGRRK
jgi:hypothetical protein